MGVAGDGQPVVVAEGVSKTFQVPHERVRTLKERFAHPLRRTRFEQLDALDEVSFEVGRGEFFGIVGRNGSGKSTLLKCLAGIYAPDNGTIRVDGRVSTLIELGVGFNPELAARDNVRVNAVMLGLTPREASDRFEEIIEFAELERFVDLKLRNYSSGMQVRLGFSIMTHVDADVLLVDEVLAVGDAAFQQKCFDVFGRMRDEQRTILFVTHNMSAIQRFCDRALLLERGAIRLLDRPDRVASHYLELNFKRQPVAPPSGQSQERYGNGAAEIVGAWFEDGSGEPAAAVSQGEVCTLRTRIAFRAEVQDPDVGVLLEDESHHPLFATTSDRLDGPTGRYVPGDEIEFSVSFENVFAPGRLYASPWISGAKGSDLMDRRPRIVSTVVTGARASGGLVDLAHDVQLEHEGRRLDSHASA
jgi:ABC-type polysaccharide/polyol phosphate transport system ATPase subunit